MYYTATPNAAGHSNHVVAYRTSTDLINWSARRIAYTDPLAGTSGGPTESPSVVEHDGWWYLFACCRIDYISTAVYRNRDPFHFDAGDQVGHIRSTGPRPSATMTRRGCRQRDGAKVGVPRAADVGYPTRWGEPLRPAAER